MKQAGADSPGGKTSGDKLSGSAMLKAVGVGLALIAVAALLAETVLLPLQGAKRDDTRLYDYLYSGVKSTSTAFTLENMSDDGYLVFGSSEFYIGKKLVPQCPAAVFGEHVTGVDMTFVGEAYDQSLWHAIAAGAYGDKVERKKVALVVSPQWFFKGNGQQSKFKSKFSYDLYRQFCDNDSISDETKSHVRQRLAALGIDETSLAAANDDTPLDALNNVMYSFGDDLSARFKLVQAAASAPEKSYARKQGEYTGEPDWDALLRWADDSGAHACTNNDYGIYDDYWTRNSQFHVESDQDFKQAEDEFSDLRCFLDVCEQSGLEPLVIMLPMHGMWYDAKGVNADTRAYYYDRVRGICDDAGVAYADFSSCEYEKYFLCDTVHPGWRGWVRIEHSFYDFVNGRDDDFLAGGAYGTAPGLAAEGSAS